MTEIRYRDKRTGRTVVYETTSETDPETGETVRGRRYLGMIDEETGELVPTLGRRGRRPGSRNRPKAPAAAAPPPLQTTPATDLEVENHELRERVRELEERLGRYREAVRAASEALGGLG